MKFQILTLIVLASLSSATYAGQYACCVKETPLTSGDQSLITSNECPTAGFSEMREVSEGVFLTSKMGHSLEINLNKPLQQMAKLTRPDGSIQTGPEKEITQGLPDFNVSGGSEPRWQIFFAGSALQADCHPR